MSPQEIIDSLGLVPHPEGGHYVESWRHQPGQGRGVGTAIYYLLRAGERSHWHRIDATEIWHFYAGASLELQLATAKGSIDRRVLGTNFAVNERPQIVVAPHQWQAARSLGEWTLVGCTVSPAFEFGQLELAAPDWTPG